MSRALTVKKELGQIRTIEDLTQAFEGIASIHISNIRDNVVASKEFFAELWPVYRSLRINPKERLARAQRTKKGRNVFVAVTGEGKLGTQATEHIVDTMLGTISDSKTDIIAVGTRGSMLLQQRNFTPITTVKFPVTDTHIALGNLVQQLYSYDTISVFYQTYESLRVQKVARIDLISAVRELGQDIGEDGESINSQDYIFEPNIQEIADYMESVMMGIAFLQIIMEAKLAGYAERFNAMSRAKSRAHNMVAIHKRQYYRIKRSESDERLKEIMKVTKLQRSRT